MNPWVIVGFLAVLIGSNVGTGFYFEADGKAKNELTWQTREAKINGDAATKIAAADQRVRDTEHAHAAQINAVDTTYQNKIKEKNDALAVAIRNAKSNGMFAHSASSAATGNAAGAVAAGAGVSDGQARSRLSDVDARFLLSEAARADKVVEQLNACQGVVMADRAK